MSQNKQAAKFWSVKAENMAGALVGHFYLYGSVSSMTWWGDEVTPKQFLNDLSALGEITELRVHIFSDGGDVFAGTAIYSMLKQQQVPVHVYIEGIAASIATVIAMAGDKVYISQSGMMYIHNPLLGLFGYYYASQMETMVQDLEKLRAPIVAAYQAKTGKTPEEIAAYMDGVDDNGTWFTAAEAIAAGFATGYIPEEFDTALDCVAQLAPNVYQWQGVRLDFSQYSNAPQLPVHKTRSENMKGNAIQKQAANSTKPSGKAAKADLQPRNDVKAGLVQVTCPDCGATFDQDVSGEQPGAVVSVTCPDCGATFDWDTAQGEEAVADPGSAKGEVIQVTCPECGAAFDWEVNQEAPGEPDTVNKAGNFASGVVAERKRVTALDSIAEAYPGAAKLVAKAKREGWTYDNTCRKVFGMMSRAAEQDEAAATAFLDGFAEDTAAGGKVNARPNGGNGKGSEADEIHSVVANYKTIKNGGKKK